MLPSGVGVYLSLFKDVRGSRIIFAGPNKTFTKTNKEQSRDSNHAVYMADSSNSLENPDDNMQTRELRFDPIGRIRTSLYSFAIVDDILQEMGFESGFDLEKLVDQPEFFFCVKKKNITFAPSIKMLSQ